MMGYKRYIYWLFPLSFLIFSCQIDKEQVIGNWAFDYYDSDKNIGIEYLFIDEEKATLVDDNSVKYSFDYRVSNNNLIIDNQYQEIIFPIQNIHKDSFLTRDSLVYFAISDEEADTVREAMVDLIQVEAGKNIETYFDMLITPIKINPQKQLSFVVDHRKYPIHKLQLYIGEAKTCVGCLRNDEIILLLDKETSYQDLRKIYFITGACNSKKIALATQSHRVGEYKIIYTKVGISEEDLIRFRRQYDLSHTPPYPPTYTKKNFVQKKNYRYATIQPQKEEQREQLFQILKEGDHHEVLLINLDSMPTTLDFIKLINDIYSIRRQRFEAKSIQKYGKNYKELDQKSRREIYRTLPYFALEMTWK